ncbi:MAG: shikimate dehydrogenase [Elainellaceae cyanobacterium]
MITGTTRLLGVIGYPIHHSLSPVMHNAAIAQLQADYAYLPFPIAPDHLATAIAGFEAIGLEGFSVTIPHKQAIMPLLSEISEVAQAIGAVNTVWRTKQGWKGTNTDVTGFLTPLRSQLQDWSKINAVILGNGGAARAVVAACTQLGCKQVQVVGRNSQKLQAFLDSWQGSSLTPPLSVHDWEELPALLPHAGLLVNTTPIGMAPHAQASPLSDADLKRLTPGTIAYDLIYTPRPTQFLQQAETQGAVIMDGLEMLVQQGAAALELWLNQAAPVEVMRRSLLNHFDKTPG